MFNAPEDKDEGIFQCFVDNGYGVSVSYAVNFREAKLASFPYAPRQVCSLLQPDLHSIQTNLDTLGVAFNLSIEMLSRVLLAKRNLIHHFHYDWSAFTQF